MPRHATAVDGDRERVLDALAGELLRRHRVARGLSQTALADAVGLSFQQIQKYEKGLNRIGISRLIGISKVLEIAPADLIPITGRVPEPTQPQSLVSEGALKIAMAYDSLPPGDVKDGIRALISELADLGLPQDEARTV